jgi:CBS domain containing-hemolysin-like protein
VASLVASATLAGLAALGEHRLEALLDNRENPPFGEDRLARRLDKVRLSLQTLDLVGKILLGTFGAFVFGGVAQGPWSCIVAWAIGILIVLLAQTTLRGLVGRDPERNLVWMAPFGAGLEMLLGPVVAPLWGLSKWVRGPGARTPEEATEELEYLIEKSSEAGTLDAEQRELLESVIEFTHVRVREIMVPRPKVVALPLDASYEAVIRTIVESGYSRIPVFDTSVDQIAGVLYAKRLLEEINRSNGGTKNRFRLADHLAPPFFIPETMRISHLLAEFQRRNLQIALVVDEFGGTAGLVTLEDVVEEIVGEIRDESDREEQQPIRVLGDGILQAEGSVSIRDLEDFVEEHLPDWELEFPEEGDYDTVGGFVTTMAGHVPKLGQQLRFEGFLFTVRAADQKRVAKVEIALEARPEAKDELRKNSAKRVESDRPSPMNSRR